MTHMWPPNKNVLVFSSWKELLVHAIQQVKIDGSVCEFGVHVGRTIQVIADHCELVYGFDSFEGLPERWRDGFEKGMFALSEIPKLPDNVKIYVGLFQDTIPVFLSQIYGHVKFLHIDCDLYSSACDVLNLMESRITSGTIIVFDEFFNYQGYELGEMKSFFEFLILTKKSAQCIGYVPSDQQAAFIII